MDSSWINVNGENVQTLQILLMTTLVTLLPSMVVMMTSFTCAQPWDCSKIPPTWCWWAWHCF